jgi:hypothetical protein
MNLGTLLQENHNNILNDRYRQVAGQLVGIDTAIRERKGSLSGLFLSRLLRGERKMAPIVNLITRTDFGSVKAAIHRKLIQN